MECGFKLLVRKTKSRFQKIVSPAALAIGGSTETLVTHGRFWAATGCNAQGTGCKIGGCPNGVWYVLAGTRSEQI